MTVSPQGETLSMDGCASVLICTYRQVRPSKRMTGHDDSFNSQHRMRKGRMGRATRQWRPPAARAGDFIAC